MNSQLSYLFNLITKFDYLGNWLFFIIAFIECTPLLGTIFPGGTLIFIGGILAAHGYFNPINLIIFATIGAMLGDYASYLFGRWGRQWIVRKKIIREETILKSELFFFKYGAPSIFWARITGSTWATMPFISGSMRVKQRIFLFWNSLGAIGWGLSRVLFGYFSGNIIAIVIRKWTDRLGLILLISLIVLFLYWLIKKHHENIWRRYVKASQTFSEKLFSLSWYKKLTSRYQIVDEFLKTKTSQEKILGGFISLIILIILYILVLVLDII